MAANNRAHLTMAILEIVSNHLREAYINLLRNSVYGKNAAKLYIGLRLNVESQTIVLPTRVRAGLEKASGLKNRLEYEQRTHVCMLVPGAQRVVYLTRVFKSKSNLLSHSFIPLRCPTAI